MEVLLFSQASASGSRKIWAEAGRTNAATRVGRVSIMLAILSWCHEHRARDSQRTTILNLCTNQSQSVPKKSNSSTLSYNYNSSTLYLSCGTHLYPQKMHVKR